MRPLHLLYLDPPWNPFYSGCTCDPFMWLYCPNHSRRTSVWPLTPLVVLVTPSSFPYFPAMIMSLPCVRTFPIILVGPLCAPVIFWSYLLLLWVSLILPVVLSDLLCFPYSSGRTCDPFTGPAPLSVQTRGPSVYPLLISLYSWPLSLPCTLPTVYVPPSVQLVLFFQYSFKILPS